ncbi:TIGR00725 family protein [Pseudochelatococcus sp. G4_1912]|uniref:TIGR00725 family protein n=1 Tax=Pseudochelatococcus sp. G4_1912 TaxID=3114288 RepID=UPI0039C60ABB
MSYSERNASPSLLAWSAGEHTLYRYVRAGAAEALQFNPWMLQWEASGALPDDVTAVASGTEALRLVFTGAAARRVPIGIIGPRDASSEEITSAYELGRMLAEVGLQLICGGKGGVMEAACKGHLEAGGLPIGVLPDTEWREGNPYVAIPLATGIGPVRNAILARASVALVAIGGGYGTLTEMAYGLHFGRPVFTLGDSPFVEGAVGCKKLDEVIAHIAEHLISDAPVAD